MINAVLDIKLLAPEEWLLLKATRLRGLRDSPDAFASDYAVEVRWTEARWRQLLAAATWVVAIEAGAVIGIAGLFDEQSSHGRHIESIWVAPTHRQLGVFRALLTALIDRERRNGARFLALWVLENNDNAKTAYSRLGFVPTGERQPLPGNRFELRLRLQLGD
jgi:GNAT superfamily N-acetyltransferase